MNNPLYQFLEPEDRARIAEEDRLRKIDVNPLDQFLEPEPIKDNPLDQFLEPEPPRVKKMRPKKRVLRSQKSLVPPGTNPLDKFLEDVPEKGNTPGEGVLRHSIEGPTEIFNRNLDESLAGARRGVELEKMAASQRMLNNTKRTASSYKTWLDLLGKSMADPMIPPETKEKIKDIATGDLSRQVTPPIVPPEKVQKITFGHYGLGMKKSPFDVGRSLADSNAAKAGDLIKPQQEFEKSWPYQGASTVLGYIGKAVDPFFRTPAGFAKGVQEEARKVARGEYGGADTKDKIVSHILSRAWDSLTNDRPVHFADVNREMVQAITGRQKLTDGENLYAEAMGFLQDMALPLPHMKEVPRGRVIGGQIGKALEKAGAADVGEFARLGDWVSSLRTHPERMTSSLRFVRKMAKKLGVDPAVAEQSFVDIVGREGGGLGKVGIKRLLSKGPSAQLTAEERMFSAPGTLKSGWLPKFAGAIQGEIKYGAGGPGGIRETIRTPQALKMQEDYRAIKQGNDIEKVFGKQSEEFARVKDAEGILKQGEQEIKDLKRVQGSANPYEMASIENQINAKRVGMDKSLEKLEMTPEKIADIKSKMTPKQTMVYNAMDDEFKRMAAQERVAGYDISDIDNYISRIETKASKKKRVEQYGAGAKHGDVYNPKETRLGVEAGVGLGGTSLREFEQKSGKIYALRKRVHGMMMANADAERIMTSKYGVEARPSWFNPNGTLKAPIEARMKANGQVLYRGSIGPSKGKLYVMDKQSAHILDRMVNPDNQRLNKLVKALEWYTAWWKSRATVIRPGFTVRNIVGGNIPNLWLADVKNIPKAMSEAAGIQSLRGISHGMIDPPAYKVAVYHLFGKDIKGVPRKIGKYTPEEVLREAEKHKVFGGGEWKEMERMGNQAERRASSNPLSMNFAHIPFISSLNTVAEENARLALFIDRLKKGYTPAEAAETVARYIFNYDELSQTMRMARGLFPFWTWNYKNWGLQIQRLAERPDKYAKMLETIKDVQQFDPTTPRERQYEVTMGKDIEEKNIVRVPFVRGKNSEDEMSRMYLMLNGIMPPMALNQMAPAKIGETLGEMLHPVFWVVRKMGEQAENAGPMGYYSTYKQWPRGKWGTVPRHIGAGLDAIASVKLPGQPPSMELVDAPSDMAESLRRAAWAHGKAKELNVIGVLFRPEYDRLDYNNRVMVAMKKGLNEKQAHDYARATARVLRWKWPRIASELIQRIDPGMATINRLFRAKDEQISNSILQVLLGIRARPYGKKEALESYQHDIEGAKKEVQDVLKSNEQLGQKVKKGKELQGYY